MFLPVLAGSPWATPAAGGHYGVSLFGLVHEEKFDKILRLRPYFSERPPLRDSK